MEEVGVLEAIYRYPVKSMAGEELHKTFVGYGGLMGDRAFAFVRSKGVKGFPWHTAREQEDMVLFRPRFRDGAAMALPADIESSLGMAPGINPVYPTDAAYDVEVATPEGPVYPIRSVELSADIERRGGSPVTLRFSERSLCDCRPVSIFANATAGALGEELGISMDRRRFRANFYVDWADGKPYRENDFVGRTLQIGDRLRIAVVERDPRCKMITIDPETAETNKTILHHVIGSHGGTAGIYAAVLTEGIVRQGDPIRIA
jgi:uncharacterized protein YcbX